MNDTQTEEIAPCGLDFLKQRVSLLAFGALLLLGCGETYCESHGLVVAIWNPPPDVVDYTFEIEFDNRTVELACAPEMDKPGSCETVDGPWQISAVVYPYSDTPPEAGAAPITVSIDRGDDFSSYVPTGEIRIHLTSPTTPTFDAEHIFMPEVEGSSDCQTANEDWDLAEE